MNNKKERQLKGYYKFKKRLQNYGLSVHNGYKLKNTCKPCSCAMCSPGRVEEKAKYRLNKFNKQDIC